MTLSFTKLALPVLFVATSVIGYSQLTNGLKAYFHFNGDFSDFSTNHITGTNHGGLFGSDKHGTANSALSLSPSNYYAFTNQSVKVPFPITISAWVKPASAPATSYEIFFSDNEYDNYAGYWLNLGSDLSPNITFSDHSGGSGSQNRITFTSDTQLSVGQWYHVVAVLKAADDMDIYVDCQLTTGAYSGTGGTTIAYSTAESRIGSYNGNTANNYDYDGEIDELGIWGRELTGDELEALCAGRSLSIIEQAMNPAGISASVFPNPSNGNVLIEVKGQPQEYTATVYDPAGKMVVNTTKMVNNELSLDVSSLSPQTYIIEVTGSLGKTRLKFVKQ